MPHESSTAPAIVIIGSGVIGSSLAYRLAQGGARVTIVDRGGPAYATTGSTFAWFNSNQKTPEDYFELNRVGMRAHRELRDELGSAPWLNEGGNVMWMTDAEGASELEGRVARLQGWGYDARWIGRDEMRELEPNVQVEPEVEQLAYFPDEGWVDGPHLARTMCELAVRHGAMTRFACEVTSIAVDGGRVSGVVLANGEPIDADMVVNCAGPWADRVAALAGRTLPMDPNLGLIARVSGVAPGTINRVMHAPRSHMRPDANGLYMVHHGYADAPMESGESPRDWSLRLLETAMEYVPAFAGARLSRWTVATRPIPADGRTSAGLLPALPGYAEIVTHSGITLGPLLGRLISEEILSGDVDPVAVPFRPERFG